MHRKSDRSATSARCSPLVHTCVLSFVHTCVWQTMTSVGTPIYAAPEVMAGNHYDATADSYSFGICLVAMIRGEKDVMEFYFQALRKMMKRKTKKGMGITILNNRMYCKGWGPLLPLEFEKSYPKVCKLLKNCWVQKKEDRPVFDKIVKTMPGEVTEEVLRKEEHAITVYSMEDDALFHERMGKDEDFEEDGMDNAKMVSQRIHTETLETTLEKKDAVIEKKDAAIEEKDAAIEKKDAAIEKKDALIKELQARIKLFTNEASAANEN